MHKNRLITASNKNLNYSVTSSKVDKTCVTLLTNLTKIYKKIKIPFEYDRVESFKLEEVCSKKISEIIEHVMLWKKHPQCDLVRLGAR